MQDLIGRTLGHYRVVEQIGAGGMGVVYRARDLRLDRDVAIKVLPEEVAQRPDRLERFEREAKAVAKLSHPNILEIHEYVRDGDITFAVTELLAGETLRERLHRGALGWRRAAEIGAAIADGVATAHQAGVVHRDLNPSNVFLTVDDRVKILDFGLAGYEPASDEESATHAPTMTRQTDPGTVLGTVGYMSPEQVRGEDVDHRSDVFSLGCVLYEMMSGSRAFADHSAVETMNAILKDEPPEFETSSDPPPPELVGIVRRCLEKRPKSRFQSASDLAYNLRTISGVQMPSGAGPEPPTRERKRTALWIFAAATAVIAGVVGLALWAPWDTAPPPFIRDETKWVAVAPLENRTGDAALDPFGQRAVDAIVRGFSEVGRSADVFTMDEVPYPPGKGPALNSTPRDRSSHSSVGKKGPHIFVSGTFYLDGNELEIEARLTDYDSGERLFSLEPISTERSDVATGLEQLRERIVTAVTSHWQETLDLRLMNPPSSYEALATYVRAQETWSASEETAAAFSRVLDLDPEFHIARFFLLKVYTNIGEREKAEQQLSEAEARSNDFTYFERLRFNECSLEKLTRVEQLSLSRELVRIAPHINWGGGRWNLVNRLSELNRHAEAVEIVGPLLPTFLPDSHPIAWWALNFVSWEHHALGEYEEQLEWANAGLERFPDVGDFYLHKASALAAMGHFEAVKMTTDACLATRLRESAMNAGVVLIIVALELRAHGHPQESEEMALRAAEWFDRQAGGLDTTEREPGDLWEHSVVLRVAGRTDEAKGFLKELEKRAWQPVLVGGALGVIAARAGDHDEARRILDELAGMDDPASPGNTSYWRACIVAHLGEKDRAVELLRQGYAEGNIHSWLDHCDIGLEPLWDYPPFKELIAPKD